VFFIAAKAIWCKRQCRHRISYLAHIT